MSLIKKSKKKVFYISYNRSCEALKESFKSKKINVNRLYVIDCITKVLKKAKKISNCEYLSDSVDLGRIKALIKKAIKDGYTLVVFDSLSNLLFYEQNFPAGGNILVKFIKSFLPELEKKKGKAIFILKEKDKERFILKFEYM